jgi:uronate dehydrogenase
MKRYGRVLLTGAAGALGGSLRPKLGALCDTLRVSDRADLGEAGEGEELFRADLEDAAAVEAMMEGVDAVAHFGGIMRDDWEALLGANVVGVYNLYKAAQKHGVKRIVYASSNHATGFYRTDEVISAKQPTRPDSLYGVTKTWGENLSRLWFDRYGMETACLRIGSCMREPRDIRALATWLSYGDLERLVRACLTAPVVGHAIVFGASRNGLSWWDNTAAAHIGYHPQDSADDYREALEAKAPPLDLTDRAAIYQGGAWARVP